MTLPVFKKEFFKKSFQYRSTILWNSLPKDVKSKESLQLFKVAVKDHLCNSRTVVVSQ